MKFMKLLKIVLIVCAILLAAWIQITVYAICFLYWGFKEGLWPNVD
jgi:heme/copper-type cytochrome/quinol oxidase subunit 4